MSKKKKKAFITTALDKELVTSLESIAKDLDMPLSYVIEIKIKGYDLVKKELKEPAFPEVYNNLFDNEGKININKELMSYMMNIREEVGLPLSSQIEMILKGYYVVK